MAKLLRIFISSPGDVTPERRRAALVIEKLAKEYARFFEIRPYLWETEPMLASGHFQDAIVPPGETDILVLILWARLGTPLPERSGAQEYRGIDGRVPVTGTEWEFEAALAAQRRRGLPDLLTYRKKAPPTAEYRSDADLEQLRTQLQKLEAFWTRHFVDQGEFRAAFGTFDDLDGFESKLESDLRQLIERRVAALSEQPDEAASATWLKGSPFRGLETYRCEHAPIFFGRSEATRTAVEHLVENAEIKRPFLLVLGASGAGKSSLAQAGIVPALAVRGVVPGVGAWRRAVIRPGGHPGGPFMALAAGLAADDALPELLAGQDTSALARHLEAAAADPGFPVVSALTAPEQAARRRGELLSIESIRLILVVDQLEELFTLGEVTPDQRKAFILCLRGLMDSGRVFVVATMRSDYWHRAADVPLLVALSEGRGRLDLLPPSQAEIAEMIRRPAEVAGLWFENDPRTEIRLDAALAEDAAHEPGALPLLSFLLDALYARDVQSDNGSTLRYASMQALGGLKGAIATRAEAAFNALPADAQAALPKALRALVTVSRSGAEPTARAVPMSRFADGSPERRVVDAFLDPQVRLLVADGDGDGARVRLAHEALMTHWERARDQLVADRRDLEIRALIEQQQARWMRATGSVRRKLLLRDPDLANGIDLVKRWGEDIETRLHDFILRSRRARRWRLATFILIPPLPFIVLTLMGLAVILFSMYDRANVRNKMLAALDMVDGLNVQIIERLLSAPSLSPEDVSAAFEAAQNANNSDGLYYENSDDPRFDETRYLFYRGFGLAFEKANDLPDALSCAAETLALDRKRTLEGRFGFGQFSRTWKADFLTAFEGKHNAPSPIDWFVELERHSGNLPAALKAAEDQLDVYKRAITQATGYWLSGMGQYDLQRQIWDIYRQIGDLRLEGNDSEGAAAAYGRMLANVQEALEQAPGKIAGQYLSLLYRDYSKSLLSIASMKARQNDLAGAIADYEKAASIDRDHLHDMFPAVTEIEISGELAALGNLRERAGTLSDKARNRGQ